MRVVFSVSTIYELKEMGGCGPEKVDIFSYVGYLGLGYTEELNLYLQNAPTKFFPLS